MRIVERFEHFILEWDMDEPDNISVDAYDVSYNIDTEKLIKFVLYIQQQKQISKLENVL